MVCAVHFILSLSERKVREVVFVLALCSFPFGEKGKRNILCSDTLFFPFLREREEKWFVLWHFVLSFRREGGEKWFVFWHFVLSFSERKGREVVCALTLCSFPFGDKGERSGLCSGTLFFPFLREREEKWFVLCHFVLSLSKKKGVK